VQPPDKGTRRISRRLVWLLGTFVVMFGCSDAPQDIGLDGLRVGSLLGATADDGYAKAVAPRPLAFPRDHGPHLKFKSEWWYLTSVLADDSGREFGVQWTLFRQALSSEPLGAGPWLTGQAYMAHLAISDVDRQRHLHAQRLARGHPKLAGVRGEPLEMWIEDWRVKSESRGELVEFKLRAEEVGKMAIALDLHQTQPILLHGDAGLSKKGDEQASYYYSMSRLATAGRINIGQESFEVKGWTWFDREWSTSVLGDGLVGWDWFALRLDDGRDIMTFSLRRREGTRDPHDYLLLRRGENVAKLTLLEENEQSFFDVVPVRYWRDSQGVDWPVAWRLRVQSNEGWAADSSGEPEVFDIEALIDDQLMNVGLKYWEGIVKVSRGGVRVGSGYMELTGYGSEN
jgi:predicted secreted hydrolase